MFRHTIPLGRIFGITVDLDYSWFLVFGLLTWMLAVSYFLSEFKNWNTAEFWFAVAGPIVSFALAALFLIMQPLLTPISPLLAAAKYLALINAMLALFNLIPGFPLDGGRVFRANVWGVSRNFRRATLIAADTGRFVGFLFIAFGVWLALRGNFFNGLWIAFIGWFLESAAAAQVQQQVMQGLLAGHKVSEAMGRDYTPIPADTTLESVVHDHILTSGRTSFV